MVPAGYWLLVELSETHNSSHVDVGPIFLEVFAT